MCSSCVRMAIQCFGYRSSPLFRITDETSKVVEKAGRDYTRLRAKKREELLTPRPPVRDKAELLSVSISPPLEATAIGYFFSVFSRSGTFAYLPEYAMSLAKDDSIVQALCASALGSMALQYRDVALSHSARRYYTASLMRINRDLSKPEAIALDSTLLRVVMLSAFESLDFHKDGNPQNWGAHVEGSSRLLLMRGKEQLKNRFGRLLFHHAGVNILVHSMVHGIAIPAELLQLFEHATFYPGEMDSVSTHIMSLLLKMAVTAPRVQNMQVSEVLKKIFPLDDQAGEFLEELSELAPFQVINITNSSDEHQQRIHTFEGHMHRYQDQQTARLYNTARLIRLTLKQWMFVAVTNSSSTVDRSHLPGLGRHSVIEREWIKCKALSESAELVKDVLASVPYSLDLLESQDSTEARYLIWPLARIASFDVCPTPAKRYILDRLTALAQKFHLRRAMEAATMLEQEDQAQSW
jgi:hypothetical protein